MENEARSSLKITGVGSTGGGKFDDVKINGTGCINGDVECGFLDSNGASEIRGNVRAKSIKINGAMQIKGDVVSEQMDVNGTANVSGEILTEKIKVSGTTSLTGSLKAAGVDVKGSISMDGDLEAESFKNIGSFNIGGLLNADTISASIIGNCKAREIGGGSIEIKRFDNSIVLQIQKLIKDIFNVKHFLIADTIEGDDVYLEQTTARVVRGNNVTIGQGCSIDLVEYKEDLKVLEGANIKEQKKI